jgi:hypothetical protein
MKYVVRTLLGYWTRIARDRATRRFEVLTEHSQPTEFVVLCAKWGSDKSGIDGHNALNPERKPHNYDQFYDVAFGHRRSSISAVLEVGIGSKNSSVKGFMGEQAQEGASLHMWTEYFPKSHVVGLDIDEECLFQESRIKTYQMDQTSQSSISRVVSLLGETKFDLIVDDGLHEFQAGRAFFEGAQGLLSETGIWVIEDVHAKDALKYQAYFSGVAGFRMSIWNFGNEKLRSDDRLVVVERTQVG